MTLTNLAYATITATALVAAIPATPAFADLLGDTYVSFNGTDTPNTTCFITMPCRTLDYAAGLTATGGVVHCLDSDGSGFFAANAFITRSVTIDCSNMTAGVRGVVVNGAGITVHIIGLQIWGTGTGGPAGPGIDFKQGAALYVEKCKVFGNSGAGILFEPSTAAKLYVLDSIVSENTSGIILKPGSAGAVEATFDHVRLTSNTGGGIKTDSTNGAVTLDVIDSVISGNAGNGMNAVSGQNNMVNLSRTTIAGNGAAGVQANGTNSAALVDTTLLDSNTIATLAINGGRLLTYGNNRIVGSAGSGFTGPAVLQ